MQGDGTCTVTVPFRVPLFLAERFVQEKRAWIVEKQTEMKKRAGERRQFADLRPFREAKSDALRFATQRVAELNTHYGFTYRNVSVRNQKTRWGSCSKRGNLNFNYRILYLPPHLADYLIVHELCHLKEFNHSRKFWQLVEKVFPEYCELRRELKKYSL